MTDHAALSVEESKPGRKLDVFFNRPGEPVPIYRVRDDMRAATSRLALASAWFTDDETATAFAISPAAMKVAIVARSDMNRRDSEYKTNALNILKTARGATIAAVGGPDFRSGTMHHKFVVADNVVWFGSFNFTFQAKKNFETLVRMEHPQVADKFWAEANEVAACRLALRTTIPNVVARTPSPVPFVPRVVEQVDLFDCARCNQRYPMSRAVTWWTGGAYLCEGCSDSETTADATATWAKTEGWCGSCGGSDACATCGGEIGGQATGACWCSPSTRRPMTCSECAP